MLVSNRLKYSLVFATAVMVFGLAHLLFSGGTSGAVGLQSLPSFQSSISGTVTDSSNAGLSGICVSVNPVGNGSSGSATTQTNGSYTVNGLSSGSYTVRFYTGCGGSGNYASQFYNGTSAGAALSSGATAVSVGVTPVTGINAVMAAPGITDVGTITGTVTDSTSAPLANICVDALDASGNIVRATTNANGSYVVAGLAVGSSYTVEFSTGCGGSGNYALQYYNGTTAGTPSSASATAVLIGGPIPVNDINAVMAVGATISGTVTNASSAQLANICVFVTGVSNGSSGFAQTGSDGKYTVSDLAPGNYTVEFYNGCGGGGNYTLQYYNNTTAGTPSSASATAVAVATGSSVTGINAVLTAGATISGTVVDSSGAGLYGVCVNANSLDGNSYGSASTAQNGAYTVNGLAPGSYSVSFSSGCGISGNYATQSYNSTVVVTTASPATGINALFSAGTAISGVVTDSNGTGLKSVCVQALSVGGSYAFGFTASNGAYTMVVAPGSYTVSFINCGPGSFASQYYNDTPSGTPTSVGATWLNVTAVTPASGINAVLAAGATISGKVTGSDGVGLANVCVYASTASGSYGTATTGSDGTYTVSGLAPGTYTLEFSIGCGVSGNYATQDSGAITVTSSTSSVTGINAVMTAGATISGTVTDSSNAPLSGICVDALNASGIVVDTATTGSDGTYTMTGLASGSYHVQFSSGCGSGSYATQFYNATSTPDFLLSTAISVSAIAGSPVPNINAEMTGGATISGTVTNSGGAAAGVCVQASTTSGLVGTATTGSDGTYTITGLAPGSYTVEFFSCGGGGSYETQYWNGSTTDVYVQSDETSLSVSVATPATGINAVMGGDATISGTVTTSGAGLSNVCVMAYSGGLYMGGALTQSDGTYIVNGLAPGSYTVEFFNCGVGTYSLQWYNATATGTSSSTSATSLSVSVATPATGINAVMGGDATISGTVTTSGARLPGVCVYATPVGGGPAASTTTATDGTYTVTGLAAGSYDVQFKNCGSGSYVSQYYSTTSPGSSSSFDATPVAATSASPAIDINVNMAPGATMSGIVTDSNGAPLSNICVKVYFGGLSVGGASSASKGTYAVNDIPSGSYKVQFTNCGSGSYLPQWYNGTTGASSRGGATSITTTVATPAIGINAVMIAGTTISGTVTDSGGAGLSSVCVYAYTVSGSYAGFARTGSDGTYTLNYLPSGSYKVEFYNGCGSGNYLSQYYNDTTAGASSFSGATPIAVTAASPAIGIDAVMAAGATISGTVTGSSGAGLSGVCVNAITVSGSYAGFARTGSDGTYTLGGLAPGSYTVEFSSGCGSGNYLSQYYNDTTAGASSFSGATPIAVTVATPAVGINAVMSVGGTISGTVTDSSGAGLSGICVYPFSNGSFGPGVYSSSNGTYTLTGLAPGSYTVYFTTCGAGNYVPEWYNGSTTGASSSSGATAVAVTVASPAVGIDAVMNAGTSIAGIVTDSNGVALSGICASAYLADGTYVTSTQTAPDGTYTLLVAPGSYTVQFNDCGAGTYQSQYYSTTSPGSSSSSDATPVTPTVASPAIDINAVMTTPATISGNVTDTNGAQLSGICVDALDPSGNPLGFTQTAPDGTYTITGLAAGSYTVEFINCGAGSYLSQVYNGAIGGASFSWGATPVTVTAGSSVTGVDAVMTIGATISGTVTDSNGTGLSNICVYVSPVSGSYEELLQTGPDGTYTYNNFPAGSYTVQFTDCGVGTYVSQYYNGTSGGTSSSFDATPVPAPAGSPVSGIGAAMTTGATITGTVTDSNGAALSGICVQASPVGGGLDVSTQTASDGSYSLVGLAASAYTVQFNNCGVGTYESQWYNATPAGASLLSGAASISVSYGTPVTGVNAAMAVGATISGTVTDSNGADLTNVCVNAMNLSGSFVGGTQTASDGSYTLILAPGSYTVQFNNCGVGTYASQWYNATSSGAPAFSGATAITAIVGSPVTNVNAAMAVGATISGTVTNSSGAGISNVCVNVLDSSGVFVQGSQTASDGTYTLIVAPGSYTVRFNNCGVGNYVQQFYNGTPAGAPSFSGATSFSAIVGTPVININAVMAPDTTISGTVTNSSGAGLSGVCVDLLNPSSGTYFVALATTGSDGTYTFRGLAAGSYQLYFDAIDCSAANYGNVYYDGTSTGNYSDAAAATVSVATGEAVTGINVTMSVGTTISGTVTAAAGGAPVANVCVDAYTTSTGTGEYVNTGVDGTYTITGLAPGSYTVEFSTDGTNCGGGNYVDQFYNGTTGGASSFGGGLVVATSVASPATGINAAIVGATNQAPLSVSNVTMTGTAGTGITLTTLGGSGAGAVSYSVTGTGCSVSGSSLSASGADTCVVTATKAANGEYVAASSATATFTFSLASQATLRVANATTSGSAGTAITLTTSGGSGTGTVSFTVTGTGCAVSGTSLSASGADSCVVTAHEAASGIYSAASSATKTFTFALAAQATLSISNVTTTGTAGTAITLTTTGGSGTGALTFNVSGTGCSVSGTSLSASGADTCRVTAHEAASGIYAAASSVATTFTFSLGAQAPLSVSNVTTSGSAGTAITLTTSGGSGSGVVSFTVIGTGCSVSGTSLSATGVDSCVVTATKAASGIYSAATSGPTTFTFSLAAQATLRVSNVTTSGSAATAITLTSSGGSGSGAVTFTVTGTGCSVSGTSLSASGADSCVVTAHEAASGIYGAASSVTKTFTFSLGAQAPLSISNVTLTGTAGTGITLTTTGGLGTGALTFNVSGTGCSVSGSSLSASGAVTCKVTAHEAASGVYAAASSVAKTFTFSLGAQAPLSVSNVTTTGSAGTAITLTTSGGSGSGAVSYSVTGTGCSVSGSSLSASGVDTCVVTARKAASGIYSAATSTTTTFTFSLASQATLRVSNVTISGSAGTGITLTSAGGSGTGTVSFSVTGTGCAVSGSSLSASGADSCVVTAAKAASGAYGAATSVTKTFTFSLVAQPTLSVSNATLSGTAGTAIRLTTSGGSELGVISFRASGTGCSVSGYYLSASGADTCTVTAHETASGIYAAASSLAVTFTFSLAVQNTLSISNVSTTGTVGTAITLTTTGGSGAGAVSYRAVGTGCSISGSSLSASSAGTCVVTATKAAYGVYGAASSTSVTFTFLTV
ncbi:MAG TPA: carboxypeptidase regulatory-like domain-containing protein [Acidimicrobiales bacterium]